MRIRSLAPSTLPEAFVPEIATAATAPLAARLQVAARDFTGYSPLPEPGMLELWLEGKGPPSGSGKAASARQAARPAGPPDLVRFLKRLAAGPGHH